MDVGFKKTCTVLGSAERGGEGDGIFWSEGGAVFGDDDFGGESSGGFRAASGFEPIP